MPLDARVVLLTTLVVAYAVAVTTQRAALSFGVLGVFGLYVAYDIGIARFR